MEATVNQVLLELNKLPEDEQAEIVRRRLICADCPFSSSNAVKDGYKSDRIDEHCIMCGCTIKRKTASLSDFCGITCCSATPLINCDCKKPNLKQYNIENGVEMEPKWKSYKKETNE